MEQLPSRRDVLVGAVASATALAFAPSNTKAAEPKVHVVEIKEFAFVPERLVVSVGDTIRWANEDLAPHTATADAYGWDTGEITRGNDAEIVITEGMETTYFCAYHPHMKGSFVISGD